MSDAVLLTSSETVLSLTVRNRLASLPARLKGDFSSSISIFRGDLFLLVVGICKSSRR